MKYLATFLVCLAGIQLNAQNPVGPYEVGVPIVDTIYTGTYGADGTCPVQDVLLMTGNLVPYTSGLDLELHILATPTPVSINGALISVGQVLPINSASFNFGIDFDAAGILEVAVVASGTPDSSGQEHVCWVDQLQTLSNCDNVWQLNWGESLIPCFVQPSVGIEDLQNQFLVKQLNEGIEVVSRTAGSIDFFDMNGRMFATQRLTAGTNRLSNPTRSSIIFYRITTDQGMTSGKLFLK